ncbi:Clostridial hydrophobic W [Gimesia panareensis]|uniref:Clostridial hydrophobic W n=1 Tax=Gimesia panareensis TaxID=2527978 RepID=A0A518FWD7_9PLAN|nr:hypothetical protein [Gimesia panareensis]QDV20654.1 Clostridial hydrophobic W [Gimesia panareensis]
MTSDRDWIDRTNDWFKEGRCENKTDREIQVCVNEPGEPQRIERLGPGERTRDGLDCDGIIHDDGGATKIHGRTGWTTEKSPEWVRENWPNCARLIAGTNEYTTGGLLNQNRSDAIKYFVHCQGLGDSAEVQGGWFVGTRGHALCLEGFQVNIKAKDLDLRYMAHLQGIGDVGWQPAGSFIGTRGESRRLEGFAIELIRGNDQYDVAYMAHLQDIGDTRWFRNGDFCGTRGEGRRVEALSIAIVNKGASTGGYDGRGTTDLGGSVRIDSGFDGVRYSPL